MYFSLAQLKEIAAQPRLEMRQISDVLESLDAYAEIRRQDTTPLSAEERAMALAYGDTLLTNAELLAQLGTESRIYARILRARTGLALLVQRDSA